MAFNLMQGCKGVQTGARGVQGGYPQIGPKYIHFPIFISMNRNGSSYFCIWAVTKENSGGEYVRRGQRIGSGLHAQPKDPHSPLGKCAGPVFRE
jgi:hypothetical protein